jgi:RNA polymerase sigma-70 factor (ECF subfamily)
MGLFPLPRIAANQPSLEDLLTSAFEEHSDAIFRHCALRLYDRERAREIVQDTYLRVWERLQAGDSIDNMRAFLFKIANNLIIDHVRRKKTTSLDELQEQGFDPSTDPFPRVQDRMVGRQAIETLGKLDEQYREALKLRYVDDLSVQEIAEILGLTPNTVSVRLHRGLKQLRSLLHYGA